MASWKFPAELSRWITTLSSPLHARVAHRLAVLFSGILFAQGRRTVASWLRAARVGKDFRAYYYFLGGIGRNTTLVASRLLDILIGKIPCGERILLGVDDSPTKRYGRWVEGAGVHHNPTPGPSDQKFLYGHIWVTLAWIVRHPCWGTIGLPLLARLYVRLQDVAKIVPWYRWKFRTKLELAAELAEWAVPWLRRLGRAIWIVTDGGYVKRPFLKRVLALGTIVVGRLRKDAALHGVPKSLRRGQRRGRGRSRKYGKARVSLTKRAAHRQGWQSGEFDLYGQLVSKTYKTFLATYRPVGGVIRVVLVREEESWVPFFCTDPNATVRAILEAVADRGALEQDFHDVKEVHGTGQQQVRNVWANLAVYNLNLWMHTLIELWAWSKPHGELSDRRASPWDDSSRRPSHADRRNSLRRQCVQSEFSTIAANGSISRKFRQLFHCVLRLVA